MDNPLDSITSRGCLGHQGTQGIGRSEQARNIVRFDSQHKHSAILVGHVSGRRAAAAQEVARGVHGRLGRLAQQAAEYKEVAGPVWAPRVAAWVCAAHHLEHALREGPGPLLLLDLQARPCRRPAAATQQLGTQFPEWSSTRALPPQRPGCCAGLIRSETDDTHCPLPRNINTYELSAGVSRVAVAATRFRLLMLLQQEL